MIQQPPLTDCIVGPKTADIEDDPLAVPDSIIWPKTVSFEDSPVVFIDYNLTKDSSH